MDFQKSNCKRNPLNLASIFSQNKCCTIASSLMHSKANVISVYSISNGRLVFIGQFYHIVLLKCFAMLT